MNLKTIIRSTCMCSAVALMASSVFAAPVEEINLTGSGLGGHTTLQTALDSVDDGGVINFIEAGTYVESDFIVVPGGKTFSVNNTSGGVVINQNNPGSGMYTEDTSVGPVNVTFNGYTIRRIDGTGAVFDVDQNTTQTVTLVFNNMTLETTAPADGGEAIKIDDDANVLGGGTFAAVDITFNDSTLSCARTGDDSKSAVRVQDPGWQNLTLTLNNTDVSSAAGSAIRFEGGSNNSITISGGSLSAPGDRAFEVDDPHDGCVFVIEDCDIDAERRAIFVDEDVNNNTWTIQRNNIDISSGALDSSESRAVNIDYAAGTGTDVTIVNNVVITQEDLDADENERCLYLAGVGTWDVFHNTLVGPGTQGGVALQLASGAEPNFSNNIMLNMVDPIGGSIGASVRTNNIVAGATDDGSSGSGSQFVSIAVLDLDGNYVPNTGSPAIDAGDATIGVTDDNAGNVRDSMPDVGAFEAGASPPLGVTDWALYQ